MMALRAKALYDFDSENPGEISVKKNEELTLHSERDIEGWFEGTNARGVRGLFPASYVEILRTSAGSDNPEAAHGGVAAGSYGASSTSQTPVDQSAKTTPPKLPAHPTSSHHKYQSSDDDWDDDWDESSGGGGAPSVGRHSDGNGPSIYSLSTSAGRGPNAQQGRGSGTVSRNLNRFTTFVKSGGEAFVLGEASGFVKDGDKICVIMGQYGPEWQENPYPFTCAIDDPTKQTKFKGIKSYISYKLTPTNTQSPVYRRYKHFDWLYARLVEKFPVISVPHIPEKQATGRFEEDFISKRRKGLVWWMNHMTSHPILSKCDVFQHFLTCDSSDEKAWKQGKRKAEKDELVGASFFLTISTPPAPLDLQEVEGKIEGFKAFTKKMDESLLHVNGAINEFARKHVTGFKKEYLRVGQSFKSLAQAFEIDQQPFSAGLNHAIAYTAETYEAIGDYFAEQPKHDLDPIIDLITVYQGHLSNYPDIIHVQKGALTKVKESQKHMEDSKMDRSPLEGINERCNIISFATLAEIHHFHQIRVRDFKDQMRHYLQQQISFFQKVTGRLEETLQKFDTA
ncbi:sorting nexin-18-like [Paramormyrops kingsleyae]|uniref:Sorting nexin n=1 Tax=Paramormyrops kingsleyae TaxID=1676925 RepID=A0A3B3Q9Q5_9TELE|nr:sorting nexin-18-like [Paramormyrops kingsleyae]